MKINYSFFLIVQLFLSFSIYCQVEWSYDPRAVFIDSVEIESTVRAPTHMAPLLYSPGTVKYKTDKLIFVSVATWDTYTPGREVDTKSRISIDCEKRILTVYSVYREINGEKEYGEYINYPDAEIEDVSIVPNSPMSKLLDMLCR